MNIKDKIQQDLDKLQVSNEIEPQALEEMDRIEKLLGTPPEEYL